MRSVERVRESQVLLERIARYSEAVPQPLNQAKPEDLVEELRELSDRAAAAQTEAEVLAVADDVYRLAQKTPAPTRRRTRKITFAEHRAASSEGQHVQEHAAQIRNHVYECHQELERALQNILERNEQSPPGSP